LKPTVPTISLPLPSPVYREWNHFSLGGFNERR